MTARPETRRKHALARVRRTTEHVSIAREAQTLALVVGSEAGLSLRELAAASGLGVETVRRALIAEGVTT